jgi:hypothetical protein
VSAKEGGAAGWADQRPRPRGGWRRRPNGRGKGSGTVGVEGEVGRGWAESIARPEFKKKIPFEFQLILEFDRTLENCTRRFRRNFDIEIFPKIF